MFGGQQVNKDWKEAKYYSQTSIESEREFDKLN